MLHPLMSPYITHLDLLIKSAKHPLFMHENLSIDSSEESKYSNQEKNMKVSSISDLWNKWNIRSVVILSLLLQVFLILFAPIRKKTVNRQIFSLLWLAYLMADWVVAFAIGLVSHHQGHSFSHAAEINGALLAFWSSFLLLHLGSPDTITAFSLEDSSLWRRHLLGLIFQVTTVIYVFAQIFPNDKSMKIPTMLVFLAAGIKNTERILALRVSSLPKLRTSVLSQKSPADSEFVEELNGLADGHSNGEEAMLHESIVVKHAYYFFQIFKVFLGDLIFTSEERKVSRQYFIEVSAMDALRLISVELHFIYEILHTKVLAIRSKLSYICRFMAFAQIVIAFFVFYRLDKHHLSLLDVKITYILLLGGIALDMVALFMLIFSDWTVAEIQCYYGRSSQQNYFLYLVSAMDNLRKPQFATCKFATCKANSEAVVTYTALATPLIFRRWSESIFACNIFSEFLKENLRNMSKLDRYWGIIALFNICIFPFRMATKMVSCFHEAGATIAGGGGRGAFSYDRASTIAHTKYVSENLFINELWIFIFNEVRHKSMNADAPVVVLKIFDARGDLFLESNEEKLDCGHLSKYVTEYNYDFSILIWHVATEIWYNREQPEAKNDERQFSKILSDYMFYLLVNQPDVMSTVAGSAQMIAAEMLFEIWIHIRDSTKNLNKLCEKLYKVPFEAHSKSALRVGINLAQNMEVLEEKKWKVMSGVWVEMLSYAATHIKGVAHVQVLSEGGELLAFVWLLMAHFGCFYKQEWGISYERYHLYELGRPTSV